MELVNSFLHLCIGGRMIDSTSQLGAQGFDPVMGWSFLEIFRMFPASYDVAGYSCIIPLAKFIAAYELCVLQCGGCLPTFRRSVQLRSSVLSKPHNK
jgi:hypothetical protein